MITKRFKSYDDIETRAELDECFRRLGAAKDKLHAQGPLSLTVDELEDIELLDPSAAKAVRKKRTASAGSGAAGCCGSGLAGEAPASS